MRRRTGLTKKRLAAATALLLLLGMAASWLLGSILVRPTPSQIPPPTPPGSDLTLRSSDGLDVAATYWPSRTAGGPAVLLLHGNNASRAATAANAAWLAGQGYAALAIDLRGHGESAVAPRSFGLYESRDAAAALAWLKNRRGHARVAIVGISLGGASALIGEKGPLPADALVLQAVYPDIRSAIRNRIAGILGHPPALLLEPLLSYQSHLRLGQPPSRFSPLRAIAAYKGPVLLIGGGEDHHTPPSEIRALYNAAPGPRSLWIAPGLNHPGVSDVRSQAYRARLLAFLRATVGPPFPRPAETRT
jgi:pimeloyl-ACP methyl ester carboxylesterase